MPRDLKVHVQGRTRHLWAFHLGIRIVTFGLYLARLARAEYRITGEREWQPLTQIGFHLDVQVSERRP